MNLQVAITAYQPVDTVVKTVEVPVVRTIETYVPKVVVEEKIVEVPKFVPEYVEKVKQFSFNWSQAIPTGKRNFSKLCGSTLKMPCYTYFRSRQNGVLSKQIYWPHQNCCG